MSVKTLKPYGNNRDDDGAMDKGCESTGLQEKYVAATHSYQNPVDVGRIRALAYGTFLRAFQ